MEDHGTHNLIESKPFLVDRTFSKNNIAVLPYLEEILERCRFCGTLVDEEWDFGEADCQPLKQEPRRVE